VHIPKKGDKAELILFLRGPLCIVLEMGIDDGLNSSKLKPAKTGA
jgi:hypothetical protein